MKENVSGCFFLNTVYLKCCFNPCAGNDLCWFDFKCWTYRLVEFRHWTLSYMVTQKEKIQKKTHKNTQSKEQKAQRHSNAGWSILAKCWFAWLTIFFTSEIMSLMPNPSTFLAISFILSLSNSSLYRRNQCLILRYILKWVTCHISIRRHHSSRIRFLRFLKIQKNAAFYVFLKCHVKKRKKT